MLLSNKSHLHFDINLDPSTNNPANHIEIVYNRDFGVVPTMQPNSVVIACGDYITSNIPPANFPLLLMVRSFTGVHSSSDEGKHDSGFLVIDGR